MIILNKEIILLRKDYIIEKQIINIYCDESCHLQNDHINVMTLGAAYCKESDKKEIVNEIRKIKIKHNLSPYFEIKWTKISPSQIEFYKELVYYFFSKDKLFFRGVVATGKDKLDHKVYNYGDYNKWYYKMYFTLLDKIIFPDEKYKVYIDIKDTIGGNRTRELHGALCNNIYDFKSEVILGLNQIQSHESEIMQLADLFIGALSYFHRGLYSIQEGKAKSEIIDIIKELSKQRLDKSSVRDEKKFNIFIWKPVGER